MTRAERSSLSRRLLVPIRLLGTGFAFALFGLGGLLFRFAATPWLRLRYAHRRARTLAARRIIRRWFAFFCRTIRALGLVRIEVRDPERLAEPGRILLANHPSLIDVVCLMSVLPNATTIVKAALMRNPFTRPPIEAAGYVPNDTGPEALPRLLEELESGTTFVIFPEGTRTPADLAPGEYPRMHRGATALACEARRPITPVRITAEPRWLTKETPWWRLPPEPMTLTIEPLEEIAVEPVLPLYNSRPPLATRRLTKELRERLFGVRPTETEDRKNRRTEP